MEFWHAVCAPLSCGDIRFSTVEEELIHKVTPSIGTVNRRSGALHHHGKNAEYVLSKLCSRAASINVIWEGCKHPTESPYSFALNCNRYASLRWHGSHFMSLCVLKLILKFWELKRNMGVRYTDFWWNINRLISSMWQIKYIQYICHSLFNLCLMFPSPDGLRWTHPCIGGGGAFQRWISVS